MKERMDNNHPEAKVILYQNGESVFGSLHTYIYIITVFTSLCVV